MNKDSEIINLETGYDMNTMCIDEASPFMYCIEKRQKTITPVEAGAAVLRLIVAAKESTQTEKIVSIV